MREGRRGPRERRGARATRVSEHACTQCSCSPLSSASGHSGTGQNFWRFGLARTTTANACAAGERLGFRGPRMSLAGKGLGANSRRGARRCTMRSESSLVTQAQPQSRTQKSYRLATSPARHGLHYHGDLSATHIPAEPTSPDTLAPGLQKKIDLLHTRGCLWVMRAGDQACVTCTHAASVSGRAPYATQDAVCVRILGGCVLLLLLLLLLLLRLILLLGLPLLWPALPTRVVVVVSVILCLLLVVLRVVEVVVVVEIVVPLVVVVLLAVIVVVVVLVGVVRRGGVVVVLLVIGVVVVSARPLAPGGAVRRPSPVRPGPQGRCESASVRASSAWRHPSPR